jgi:hypothetical protein
LIAEHFVLCNRLRLSFIDPEGGGFGKVLPWSADMTRGFAPRKILSLRINISPNPPSGGSINDRLFRKLKNPFKVLPLSEYNV